MARILVVEDQPGVRRFICLTLQQRGHEVTAATDGEDAVRLFEKRWFDLLIVNMLLPGRSGLEIAGHVRRHRSNVPVLFISGAGVYDLQTSGVDPRATLGKPFTPRALIARVNDLLSGRDLR